jgi:hypothetical protein
MFSTFTHPFVSLITIPTAHCAIPLYSTSQLLQLFDHYRYWNFTARTARSPLLLMAFVWADTHHIAADFNAKQSIHSCDGDPWDLSYWPLARLRQECRVTSSVFMGSLTGAAYYHQHPNAPCFIKSHTSTINLRPFIGDISLFRFKRSLKIMKWENWTEVRMKWGWF